MTSQASPFPDDRDWAGRVREGDYSAFEALFRAYYDDLVKYVQFYVNRHDIAEELVQDVFFNIWKLRQDWNPRGTLRAYLYGAARKNSLTHLRRQRTRKGWQAQQGLQEVPTGEGPDRTLEYSEFSKAVQEAIAALPERRRLIFTLSRQQGLTYAEIAAVLGISVNTVENQMVHAMKFLRGRLAALLVLLAALFPWMMW